MHVEEHDCGGKASACVECFAQIVQMSDKQSLHLGVFCSQVVSSQGVAAEETSEASAGAAATHTHTLTSSS